MPSRCARLLAALLLAPLLLGSDHADPIDPLSRVAEAGGITDLFVFPTPEGDKLVVILCVHRLLTETPQLQGYRYTVNMDLASTVLFPPPDFPDPTAPDPMRDPIYARYGGRVQEPAKIHPTVTIAIRFPKGVANGEIELLEGIRSRDDVELWTGVRDDPFIFPAFFGSNVVAMVMRIPFAAFDPPDRRDFLVWATSERRGRQIDHVGRSLRTQNPRFELLNKLPPSEHVAAIEAEIERPALMRDLFVRLGLNSTFGYREDWDLQPDVLIFSRRDYLPTGYPNGRVLTDDVAALLARYGDTLLYELSLYPKGQWPRRTANDKEFSTRFPYLAEPWDKPRGEPQLMLAPSTQCKLVALGLAVLAFLGLVFFLGARFAERRRRRRQYL